MPQANVKHWRRLDNAAKLFPAASSKRDTRVFRFYCELKEDIQQEILQKAVDRTLEKYPIFLSVLRKGLFWHYLEQSNKRPVVREEYKEPCSSLYIRDKRDLLFEVTYYKKRINFEVFHVLTDGTGASEFVRELVKNYLYLAHHEDGLEDVVLSEYSESLSDQEADGFERYYSRQADRKKEKKPAAHQLRGNRRELGSLQTTEAEIPVEELRHQAKTYGVSMTVFLTAVYLCAIHRTMTRRQEQLHTLVAEEGGALLSTVTLIITESLTHGQRPFALVEYVVTDQNHRGQGLAFSLLGLAKQIAREAGCYKIMLVTGHSEPGVHRLYKKAGYHSEGKTAYSQYLD